MNVTNQDPTVCINDLVYQQYVVILPQDQDAIDEGGSLIETTTTDGTYDTENSDYRSAVAGAQ